MQIPCTLVTAIMRPNRRPSQSSSAPPLPVRGLPVAAPAAAGSTYANIIAWGQGSMDDHDYENDPEDTPSPVSPSPAAAVPTLSLESLHSALPSRGPGSSGALPRARTMSNAVQLRASAHMYGNVATVDDDDEELPSPPPPKGATTYAPALTRAAAAAAATTTAAAASVSAPGRTPAPVPPPSDDHDYENYDPTTDGPPAAAALARPALPPGRQTSGSSYEDTGAVPAGARPVSLTRPEVVLFFSRRLLTPFINVEKLLELIFCVLPPHHPCAAHTDGYRYPPARWRPHW